MKAKEVLEKYKITRRTLHNWVKTGAIKVEKTPSGRYIYLDKINEFSSITNWVNDYYGEIVTPHCILNSVYIGNYNVPIWKILVDEKEMDDINDGKKEFSSSITALMILLLVGLMLFSIFTIIITTIRF